MRVPVAVICLCLAAYTDQRSTPGDDSYVAAVVEYQVQTDVSTNIQHYVQHIQEAAEQNADVVVFPEMTLTRGARAVPVPINGILKEFPIPALQQDLYDEILVNISEAAREREVYVVINVQEAMDCTKAAGEHCPEEKVYLFNTNVVFDRTGAVIDRYRKINLFGEFTRYPALRPDLGIFKTDFGVTFGHFICFDLMFQVPAVQTAERNNITDVIFTTMWFSEMPYLTAVQIQEAYAYSMDVNFLASGANNVRVGSAGSGIYSGKAGALVSTMPGVPTTRVLVSRVPKIPGQVNFPYPGPIQDDPKDHDSLVLISDPSLPSHISRILVPGFQEFSLVDKEVTCRFRVRLNQSNGDVHYTYRAAAFSGVRSFSGRATGGSRNCAVFACTDDDINSCGKRFPEYIQNTTGIFDELRIVAIVPTPVIDTSVDSSDSAFFPISLDVSINPLKPDEITYITEDLDNNQTIITMELNKRNAEMYTFAIWGRVFEWDDEPASPPAVDDNVTEGITEGVTEDVTEGVTGDVTEGVTADGTAGVTEDGSVSVTEESSDNDDQKVPGSSVVATTSKTLMVLAIALLLLRK